MSYCSSKHIEKSPYDNIHKSTKHIDIHLQINKKKIVNFKLKNVASALFKPVYVHFTDM